MATRTINVPHMLSTRPADARMRINSLLSQLDCRSCGVCCRNGNKELPVFKKEPHYEEICDILHSRKGLRYETRPVRHSRHIVIPSRRSESCRFLTEEQNTCEIYDIRAFTCQIFPFTINRDNETGVVVLSSLCPPIAALRNCGIEFIYLSDVLREAIAAMAEITHYPADVQATLRELEATGTLAQTMIGIPVFASSLEALLAARRSGWLQCSFGFLLDQNTGEIYFPIF